MFVQWNIQEIKKKFSGMTSHILQPALLLKITFNSGKLRMSYNFNHCDLIFTSLKDRTLVTNKQLRDLLKEHTLKFDEHAMRIMMALLEKHTPVLASFISWCDEAYESCLSKINP